jgi:hypothetical protein
MEGFKTNPKMKCFKEGGSVKYESRREQKEEMSSDAAQDKKLIKKAFKQHDKAEHDKEPTEIKLKRGGRAKKELGTARKFMKPAAAPSGAKGGPNKYKVGGTVSNVYEAKKKAGDLDAIEEVKNIKPGKAAAPSKASVVPKNTAAKFCGGKSVKKMADGRLTGAMGNVSDIENLRMMERAKRARKYLGPAQQSEFVNQGGMNPAPAAPAPVAAPAAPLPGAAAAPAQDQMGNPTGMPAMKKGGKTKKFADGGSSSDDTYYPSSETAGGAYVGSRLNMPSNTRLGKASAADTALLNKQDATLQGRKDAVTRLRTTNPEYFGAAKKKGGKIKGKC